MLFDGCYLETDVYLVILNQQNNNLLLPTMLRK